MNERFRSRAGLLADNTRAIKAAFKWRSAGISRLAALLYAARDLRAEGAEVREHYELIKNSTGGFSAFRGNSAVTVAALLSMAEEPEARLRETLDVYERMKESRFRSSDYLVVAAYQIAASATRDRYVETIDRSRAFYEAMKREHPFLTGQDDYIFAAMLGLSDLGVETGTARMEQLYTALKPEFRGTNALQGLTQVLLLGEAAEDSAARVLEMRRLLRDRELRMDQTYTLPSLGVLALLPAEASEIADAIGDVYGTLREQKGFGRWSITKQELLLLSAGLVSLHYVEEARSGSASASFSTGITNLVIAQQAALAAAAASSAAASSASSSS